MGKENLRVDEVAEVLRVSGRTVRNYLAEGMFPGAFRVKRSWRIPRADLDRLAKTDPHDEIKVENSGK